MEIQRNENIEILLNSARNLLTSLLKKMKGRAILFLCSGGSALELLRDIPSECFNSDITIGVLDERYSRDEAVNNFAQLQNFPFYTIAVDAGARIIDTRPQDKETIEHLAQRFEKELRLWHTNNTDGIVIATMGIGPDGHTAGIMPFPEDPERFCEYFESPDMWVCGYDAGEKNQYPLRVTPTMTFLKKIDHSIVFCVGENKREALARVLADEGTYAETPARVIRDIKNVTLFTDCTPI